MLRNLSTASPSAHGIVKEKGKDLGTAKAHRFQSLHELPLVRRARHRQREKKDKKEREKKEKREKTWLKFSNVNDARHPA